MKLHTDGNFWDLSASTVNEETTTMKQPTTLFLCMTIWALHACVPSPATLATAEPAELTETHMPAAVLPTQVDQSATSKRYTNAGFGLAFEYPSNWFGASEYISDGTLRVEVGSDQVYPYGERPEQPSDVKNSYNVVLQYAKNNQNPYWRDTYQSLQSLADGESLSGTRSLIIRVRQLTLGRLEGFEYIATLSETARTEHAYAREVMLFDQQTNDLLTIMGQPYNVEVGDGSNWRDVYQNIDEANLVFFHSILDSITIGS